MPSSVIAGAGSALASKAVGSLMGGGKKKGGGGKGSYGSPYAIPKFRAGGLGLDYDKDGTMYATYKSAPGTINGIDRFNAVNNVAQSYKNQGVGLRGAIPGVQGYYDDAIAGINTNLGRVTPGFGDLTKARVDAVRNAGLSAKSDLRSNLSKRRVLGSSFGDDAIARTEMETGQQEAAVRAQSFLEELDLNTQLIQDRLTTQMQGFQDTQNLIRDAFSAERAVDQTQLDELNTQLSLMTGIIGQASEIAQRNAELEANYAASGAQARGGLLGDGMSGALGKGIGAGASKLMGFASTGGQGFNFGNIFGAATGAYGPGF